MKTDLSVAIISNTILTRFVFDSYLLQLSKTDFMIKILRF